MATCPATEGEGQGGLKSNSTSTVEDSNYGSRFECLSERFKNSPTCLSVTDPAMVVPAIPLSMESHELTKLSILGLFSRPYKFQK